MHKDIVREAALYLRRIFPHARSSHAHAVLAYSMDFRSKKALLDDGNLDLQDPNLVLRVIFDWKMLSERIEMITESPFKHISSAFLQEQIYAALAPACECCGKKTPQILPLGYEESEPDGWVCPECASRNSDYGKCFFCGPGYVYRESCLNKNGECLDEHDGESALSPEEASDWDSYIEYLSKDL